MVSPPNHCPLLSGVPIEEVMRHERKEEILSCIYEMIGRLEILQKMRLKGRGRAFETELVL